MIKDIKPLDWHGTKFLENIPAHFSKVKFRHQNNRAEVLLWIERNVAGRFAIESVERDDGRNIFAQPDQLIGFEDAAEATMYAMFYK